MRLSVEKSGKKGVLACKGELTINQANALKKALTRALKKVQHLVLDLKNVEGLDVSCLQLFCAAHKTAAQSKKKLVLGKDMPEDVINDLSRLGYLRPVGCMQQDNCLWKEGGV